MDLRNSGSDLDRVLSRIPWTSWSPTYASDGGSAPTVTTNTALYYQIGKLIYFNLDCTITAVSGAAGTFLASLPFTPSDSAGNFILGMGMENGLTGVFLRGHWQTSASKMGISTYLNNTVIVLNYRPTICGRYRIA